MKEIWTRELNGESNVSQIICMNRFTRCERTGPD
jgi:hypothetical protein